MKVSNNILVSVEHVLGCKDGELQPKMEELTNIVDWSVSSYCKVKVISQDHHRKVIVTKRGQGHLKATLKSSQGHM